MPLWFGDLVTTPDYKLHFLVQTQGLQSTSYKDYDSVGDVLNVEKSCQVWGLLATKVHSNWEL